MGSICLSSLEALTFVSDPACRLILAFTVGRHEHSGKNTCEPWLLPFSIFEVGCVKGITNVSEKDGELRGGKRYGWAQTIEYYKLWICRTKSL